MCSKTAVIILLVIVSINCQDRSRRSEIVEIFPEIPSLNKIFSSFDQIVAKLTKELIKNGDKLTKAVERPAVAVVNSVNQNNEAIRNSSDIFRRNVSKRNETKIVKDNEYYANKYAGKFTNKIGKKTGVKREVASNQSGFDEMKAKIKELKDRAGEELNIELKYYGTEMKKLSGEFAERSKKLGEEFKRKYKKVTEELSKKVEEARNMNKTE